MYFTIIISLNRDENHKTVQYAMLQKRIFKQAAIFCIFIKNYFHITYHQQLQC